MKKRKQKKQDILFIAIVLCVNVIAIVLLLHNNKKNNEEYFENWEKIEDIEMEENPFIKKEVKSVLTKEEKTKLRSQLLEISIECQEKYPNIWKDIHNQHQSSKEIRKIIKDYFGNKGLVSVSSGMNMDNYVKVEHFYECYLKGENNSVTIYEIGDDCSISSRTFVYRDKIIQTYFIALTWDAESRPKISEEIVDNIVELNYTPKGYLIYAYDYIVAHAAFKEYYRVRPLSDDCRRFTEQCVSRFNYLNYNFLTTDWDESNVEVILQSRLFEDLYQMHTDENIILDEGRISAEVFEKTMLACLPVTRDQLREHCGYDVESNTYDAGTFTYNGISPFCEVVEYYENGDGTIALYVDAVFPEKNTDCAYKNKIVVRMNEDGTYRYLSNTNLSS